MFLTPGTILVTGIMAAGKSTIAQRVAERLPRSVHLRGDAFRRMIVNDRASMAADFDEASAAQLELRYKLAAASANLYCEAGFAVVYQDIILGPALARVVDSLSAHPLYVVVLCPTPEAVERREAGRSKVGYGSWTPQILDEALRTDTPRLGLWLDTSELTIDETVDTIFARADEARVLPK